jgi:hypothetical protein
MAYPFQQDKITIYGPKVDGTYSSNSRQQWARRWRRLVPFKRPRLPWIGSINGMPFTGRGV